ncbi:LOW QUALITY PROTEIN: poly(A) RNA polymerase GLD2 [Colossoma macropomum]|uniref:LOW QUALITY PROTEIN: poly(A) RNA polymerase GLD2 n=1 Tax=Colossoma macropomum TaxID=42526 RepID=UPI00186476F2|nr:LOW QUALITY PROTEIN: poly(A) RNA polymerase GLD2 [Colossoma macropomum]
MLPRSPAFPHKHGQTRPDIIFTQRLLPHAFSQQQRIESHLNLTNTNFHSKPLNVFPIIPTYQWNPAPDIPFTSPNGSRTKNRKRKSDGHSQDDLKRQRFSSPHPYKQPGKTSRFSPVCRGEQGLTRVSVGEGCSPVRSPMHSPGTSHSVGCVPSLREDSCQNANSSLPPSLVKDKLSQQILELFLACEQRSEDLERKESCRAQLQRDIQRLFPCARVFLAGSSLNGFGSRSSDADLCLVVQDGPVNQRTDAVCILSLVQKLLYKLSYIERPQLIRAKVPILKFRDRISGVEFDLNVNNIVGIRNTFLLRTYAYIEKRVRPIILVIKKWASYHRINDASRGTLSSYTLVLMVLHYLQTLPEPVIPCLQKDYPECFSPVMDIHLVPDGPKNIPSFVSKNQSSLGDLLLGFLKYYATVFRWDKCVISVREAKALPKPNCREWKDKFICVEEPFDGSNTARAVHEKMKFDAIKAQFTESWQVLQVRKDLNYILPIRETRLKR